MQRAVAFPVPVSTGRLAALGTAWNVWVEAERGRFVPWLAVGMMTGAITYFSLRTEPPWWIGAAAIVGSVALVVVTWRLRVLCGLALLGLAAAIGFASGQWATARARPVVPIPTKAIVVTGVVQTVELLPEGRRVTLARARWGDDPPIPRLIRLRLRAAADTDVSAGDVIRLRALVRAPSPPAYPGAWDLQRDAFFSGIGGYGFAIGPSERLNHAEPSGIARWWQGLRDTIGQRFVAGLPGTSGAVAATLFTGTPSAIPADDRAAYRDSGLAHLLAVAGLHIGIVMGLFLGASRFLLAAWRHAALNWPTKAIAACVALSAGGIYMLATGAHVPIMRSFAMASLVALALATGRRPFSLRGWALAACILILIAPQEVLGVSFQMSFSAVLALIAGYQALRPALRWVRWRCGRWGGVSVHVLSLALTSALAGTASAPYGAYHFGHVQLYFVLANLIAVPLTAMWIMPAGLVALALMPVGLEQVALVPMGVGLDAVTWIARTVAALPEATVAVPHITDWGLAVLSVGIAWLGLFRTRWRLIGLMPILIGLASPAMQRPPDMLVSADAGLIGWRAADGTMAVQVRQGSPDRFTLDSWRQYWAASVVAAWPTADGTCDAAACRFARSGLAVLIPKGAARPPCRDVALLVSAEPSRGLCRGAAFVDRFSVWRDGAHAIWIGAQGVTIVSDRATRGERPWVPPVPTPRRTDSLPLAQRDSLPPE